MLAARRATAAAPAKAASKAAMRVRSVVVRAAAPQQQQPALAQKAKAVGKALLAQAILAAPAFAEEGKLFDFNATLPVVRCGSFPIPAPTIWVGPGDSPIRGGARAR